MPHDPLNTAYARALLEMAQAENAVDRVADDLFRLGELVKANPALLQFLKDANVTREGKRQALAELFQNRVHSLVLDMLITISDVDRANRLAAIIEEFIAQASAARKKVSGEVVTAVPLDAATLQRMAAELSRVTGRNVDLLQRVDPAILGGAIIQVGEQIIDGSLRRKLEQIKSKLLQ